MPAPSLGNPRLFRRRTQLRRRRRIVERVQRGAAEGTPRGRRRKPDRQLHRIGAGLRADYARQHRRTGWGRFGFIGKLRGLPSHRATSPIADVTVQSRTSRALRKYLRASAGNVACTRPRAGSHAAGTSAHNHFDATPAASVK